MVDLYQLRQKFHCVGQAGESGLQKLSMICLRHKNPASGLGEGQTYFADFYLSHVGLQSGYVQLYGAFAIEHDPSKMIYLTPSDMEGIKKDAGSILAMAEVTQLQIFLRRVIREMDAGLTSVATYESYVAQTPAGLKAAEFHAQLARVQPRGGVRAGYPEPGGHAAHSEHDVGGDTAADLRFG